jgi:hypothetical protein
MFILIFIVMFGLKKGHIGVYASMWGDNFRLQNRALRGKYAADTIHYGNST